MMKLVKSLGIVAALGIFWGCGGSSDGGGEIPGDVAAVLNENCQSCHGDPTANDAPMPIVTCNDVLGAAPTNSSMTVAEAMKNRINSTDNPMPPPPNEPLEGTPLQTLNDWLDDGTPGCE